MTMTARERLARKREGYLKTFCGDQSEPHTYARVVLEDLRKACGITKGGIVVSPVSKTVDPYATVYRAGMRDVYLRIVGFLSLEDSHLFEDTDHVQAETRTARSD